MNDNQLLRYGRHILLPEIDVGGQQKLLNSHALIIGLGGLGSPVAMYLAAAGVGHLTIADDDSVDLSNLQRQILHTSKDIGRKKTDSAFDTLQDLNPETTIQIITQRLAGERLDDAVKHADIVIDASDNFAARFAINTACVSARTPFVSGAATRFNGQVSVFRVDLANSPCYRCLYSDEPEAEEPCGETGVFAPLLGIIGSVQAAEALKILLDIGESLNGRLLSLDAKTMQWHESRLEPDPACPVCGDANTRNKLQDTRL